MEGIGKAPGITTFRDTGKKLLTAGKPWHFPECLCRHAADRNPSAVSRSALGLIPESDQKDKKCYQDTTKVLRKTAHG